MQPPAVQVGPHLQINDENARSEKERICDNYQRILPGQAFQART